MKIHIGGEQKKDGWKILNIQGKEGTDFIGDISDLSRFENESIDEIYASHVLEHVPQKRVLDTLKGVHRVLKAGGESSMSRSRTLTFYVMHLLIRWRIRM